MRTAQNGVLNRIGKQRSLWVLLANSNCKQQSKQVQLVRCSTCCQPPNWMGHCEDSATQGLPWWRCATWLLSGRQNASVGSVVWQAESICGQCEIAAEVTELRQEAAASKKATHVSGMPSLLLSKVQSQSCNRNTINQKGTLS